MMTPKKMLMLLSPITLLFYFNAAYSDSGTAYNNLSSEQKSAVDANFMNDTSSHYQSSAQQPVKKIKRLHTSLSYHPTYHHTTSKTTYRATDYDYEMPKTISTTEKVILVNPNVHAWGAYSADGKLIRAGLATAGSSWCSDIHRPCKTKTGTFHIYSLGSSDCKSSRYPVNTGGGAPMPYCMYFNGSQGLHGSNEVVEGNISHGCVRLRVSDAKWLRFNFSTIGTKVIIKSY